MEFVRAATVARSLIVVATVSLGVGCSTPPSAPQRVDDPEIEQYVIGPGDTLSVQVWRNPELSISVPVRPDGQISTPLVEDVQASGVTPTELARVMEDELSRYLRDPVVTVIVTGFAGPYDRQVRVIGQAAEPRALQYREDMSLMDVMIEVGGITEFAAGNRTVLVRHEDGERKQYRVRLHDLINRGEIDANIDIKPGDILIIPESFF
ncbi:MAG: XrtA/PEP-CTERM system exopolysaccharide export protein [Halorhodospira sp.]